MEAAGDGRWHLPACTLSGCIPQKLLPLPAQTSVTSACGRGDWDRKDRWCNWGGCSKMSLLRTSPRSAWPEAPSAVCPSVSAWSALAEGLALDCRGGLPSWAWTGSLSPLRKQRGRRCGAATAGAQEAGVGTRSTLQRPGTFMARFAVSGHQRGLLPWHRDTHGPVA